MRLLTAHSSNISNELDKLKADFAAQQNSYKVELEARTQQHQTDLSAQRDKMISEAEENLKEWEVHYQNYYQKLYQDEAQGGTPSEAAIKADLDACKAELEATKAQLARAQQRVVRYQSVKAENAPEQHQNEDAQMSANLKDAVKISQDEVVHLRQALQDAEKHGLSLTQALQASESNLQERQERCQHLESQCEASKQEFDGKFRELLLQTGKHAAQYAEDLEDMRKQIVDLQGDNGRSGHKRFRDSSNGRDSKRRN